MKFLGDHKLGIWAFLVATAWWPGIFGASFTPRWAVIAIGAPLVSKLDPREVDPAVLWLMVLSLAVGALSLISSPDRLGGTLELFFYALLCLVLIAAANEAHLDDALGGMALGMAVSAVLSAFQSSTGWSPVEQTAAPAGLFLNREVMAETMAPILIWAMFKVRPIKLYPFLFLSVLLLCQSRVAWLAVALASLIAYSPRSRLLTLLACAFVIVMGLVLLPGMGFQKFHDAGHRVVLWGATILSFTPFGQGLGWFMAAHAPEQYAHSDVLQAIAELGIGAVFPLAIPFVLFWSNRGNNAERAAFLCLCIEACISFPLHLPASGFMAALLAGGMACRRHSVHRLAPVFRDPDGRPLRPWIDTIGDGTFIGGGRRRGALSVRSSDAVGAPLCT